MTVSVKFTNPISTIDMGIAPSNPFLMLNIDHFYQKHITLENDPRYPEGMVRDFEVRLPNMNNTKLGLLLVDVKDRVNNNVSDNGFPWTIHVIGEFNVPKPSITITDAYNFFEALAESGGSEFQDWYIDEPGNINLDSIR